MNALMDLLRFISLPFLVILCLLDSLITSARSNSTKLLVVLLLSLGVGAVLMFALFIVIMLKDIYFTLSNI